MLSLQDQMYHDHMKKVQQQRWERQQVIKLLIVNVQKGHSQKFTIKTSSSLQFC